METQKDEKSVDPGSLKPLGVEGVEGVEISNALVRHEGLIPIYVPCI
jgi:hypothetical protein